MQAPILYHGHTLDVAAMLHPSALSITLKAEPGSTAQMTLQKSEPDVPVGAWLRLYTPQGDAGVFIARTVATNYLTGERTLNLDSAITMLKDGVYNGEYNGSKGSVAITSVLNALLGKQAEKVWQLGSVDYTDRHPWSFKDAQILSQMQSCLQSVEDPQWELDYSSLPFTINIRRRPTQATCEMRLSRNITTLSVSVDRSNMYTRIYAYGKNNLSTGKIDRNTDIYGVIERVETASGIESAGQLKSWAAARLARHCEPLVTATISGVDLSTATGEPFDRLVVGTVCRVPLPEYGTTITQRIDNISWKDLINQPDVVNVTLSNSRDDVTLVNSIAGQIAQVKSTVRHGGRKQADAEETLKQFVEKTDDGFALVSTRITQTENQMARIKIAYDSIELAVSHAKKGSAGEWLTDMESRIKQTSDSISMTVKKGEVISAINQSAEAVTISASKINLKGYVTADQLNAAKAEISQLKSGSATFAVCRMNNLAMGSHTANSWVLVKGVNGNSYWVPGTSN